MVEFYNIIHCLGSTCMHAPLCALPNQSFFSIKTFHHMLQGFVTFSTKVHAYPNANMQLMHQVTNIPYCLRHTTHIQYLSCSAPSSVHALPGLTQAIAHLSV